MKNLSNEMSFCMNFASVHARFIKKIDGSLSAHGISFTEYQILFHLQMAQIQNSLTQIPKTQAMRRIDLAESVGLSASGVTRLIAPMEKIGLVQKRVNERDARVSLVEITRTGSEIFKDASVGFDHVAGRLLGELDAKERDSGLHLLKTLGGKF